MSYDLFTLTVLCHLASTLKQALKPLTILHAESGTAHT